MFGEIYLCQFPFTSGATSKPRPALVLFDLNDDVVICRVTSAMHSDLLDVVLAGWKEAGLLKPSVARLDRLVAAEKSLLWRHLGILNEPDKTAVRDRWNKYMKL